MLDNDAARLTPKRLKADVGVDGVYPYYAGFSSRFAVSALRGLGLRENAIVLDPWNGSGTTTMAAAELNCRAIGVDLNPFACAIASAKLLTRDRANEVRNALPAVYDVADELIVDSNQKRDPLREWLSPAAAAYTRLLVRSASSVFVDVSSQSLIVVGLARALRRWATARTKNPTWSVPARRRVDKDAVRRALVRELDAIALLLPTTQTSEVQIVKGDARTLPVASNSADAVLTSPPYLTRIDYATKTKFELALLDCSLTGDLRSRFMGTTSLRAPKSSETDPTWPDDLRALLSRIQDHPSHRSKAYYFPNILQYFRDAVAALLEIRRVLVTGGTALIVVQDSYYKEIHIDLSALLSVLGCSIGLRGGIVRREPVRRVMTSINTASRSYLPDREYSECVVQLTKEAQ